MRWFLDKKKIRFKGHHSPSDVLVYVPARALFPVRSEKEKKKCISLDF